MDRILSAGTPCWGFARTAKTSTYAVTAVDRGYTIDCTSGTFSVTLAAAATLGAGFSFGVYNSGSGSITIDPNASEAIRSPAGSATTLVLSQGQGVLVQCDGTGFEVVANSGLAFSSSAVVTVVDSNFTIVGSSDATKTIKFEADAQATGADLTINAGAQTVDRTLTVPVLTSNGTLAVISQAQSFTGDQTFLSDIVTSTNRNIRATTNADYLSLIGGVSLATDPGFQLFGSAYGSGISGRLYMDVAQLRLRGINGATDIIVHVNGITDSSGIGTGTLIVASGGASVALRSFLGTIGATFAGNVLAGVQDGTAAVTGQVGEEIKSTVSGVAVAGTGAVGNITTISLTAGDWLVSAYAVITGGATGLTSGSTAKLSIVTTTATNGTNGDTMAQQSIYSLVANGLQSLSIPAKRIRISAPATYYLTEEVSYAAGSPTAAATLTATRVR